MNGEYKVFYNPGDDETAPVPVPCEVRKVRYAENMTIECGGPVVCGKLRYCRAMEGAGLLHSA